MSGSRHHIGVRERRESGMPMLPARQAVCPLQVERRARQGTATGLKSTKCVLPYINNYNNDWHAWRLLERRER